MFEIMVVYMCIGPGQRQTTPGVISSQKYIFVLLICSSAANFPFPIELLCYSVFHSNVQATNLTMP